MMDEFEKWLMKQVAIYGTSEEDYTGGKCDAYEIALSEYRSFKAKDKSVEPLEKLAERKGCELLQFGRMYRNLYMQSIRREDGNDIVIEGCSLICTKEKAREWLNKLEDK